MKPEQMDPFYHRRPLETLDEWLAIAMRGLAPLAQTRIRAEIKAHYSEALQQHLKGGSPEAEAHALALADLGDAKVAARRFSREYLTEKDARKVTRIMTQLIWEARSVWALILTTASFPAALCYVVFGNNPDFVSFVAAVCTPFRAQLLIFSYLVAVGIQISSFISMRQAVTSKGLRRLVLSHEIALLNACVFFMLIGLFPMGLGLMTGCGISHLRLRKKLLASCEEGSEAFPCATNS